MGVKLFVGGLSFTTSNDSLRDAFARYGTVQSAMVMTDRETQRSRGFGFVEMGTQDEADRAIAGMNGANLDGRMIRVDKATPRGSAPAPRGPRPMGGRPAGGPPGAGGSRPWSPRPPGSGFGGGGGGGGGVVRVAGAAVASVVAHPASVSHLAAVTPGVVVVAPSAATKASVGRAAQSVGNRRGSDGLRTRDAATKTSAGRRAS